MPGDAAIRVLECHEVGCFVQQKLFEYTGNIGEPADADMRDPQYLRFDTAVEEAGRSGILAYCMSLDPRADKYVSRIFRMRNYMVVDHVERLPEKLSMLYAALTH